MVIEHWYCFEQSTCCVWGFTVLIKCLN